MAVLSGLTQLPNIELSVIVSMTDDGGSNAVIRDQFGLLPLSDLRKSIIALAETDNALLRELFVYRFHKGSGLRGHTLGNLFMMALADISGSEKAAVAATSALFRVKGNVIPVTLEQTNLVARYDSGECVEGEHLIDESEQCRGKRIVKLSLSKSVKANPEALTALQRADYVICGPGDLYTTTLANIIVPGMSQAIRNSRAQLIFINNLMTKKGQTQHMTAVEIVDEFACYAGRRPDIVITHRGIFPTATLQKYRRRGEYPIEDNFSPTAPYKVIRANVVDDQEMKQVRGDALVRSLIRHDRERLKKVLVRAMKLTK